MNKYLYLFFAIMVTMFSFGSHKVKAAGLFEFNNLPESFNVVAGEKFEAYVNFFYSGTQYIPKGNFISSNFPNGLQTSPIISGGGGSYSFKYSGIATKPGKYFLTATLTDDYGALLNKPITVNVDGLTFKDVQLPHAEVGKIYSQDIEFNYNGKGDPVVLIDTASISNDLQVSFIQMNSTNSHFTLKLVGYKTGKYTLKFKAILNGAELGEKTFDLYIDEVNQGKVVSNLSSLELPTKEKINIPNFNRILKSGLNGNDIKELQYGLIKLGYLPVNHNSSIYFGNLTKKAVIQFQKDNSISPASGVFGSATQKIFKEKLKNI